MSKFTATIEFLKGQSAAIVTMFDSTAEWSGAGRIEVKSGSRDALYEAGYREATARATIKGGTLDRYTVAP